MSTHLDEFQTKRKGTWGTDAKPVYNVRARVGCEEDHAHVGITARNQYRGFEKAGTAAAAQSGV